MMNRIKELVRARKARAEADLRAYAAAHAPHVPPADVDQLCLALGEVSYLEATAALDRWNLEARRPPCVLH